MVQARRRGKAGERVKGLAVGPLAVEAGDLPIPGRSTLRSQRLSMANTLTNGLTSARYTAMNWFPTRLTCWSVSAACGMISAQCRRSGRRRSMAINRRRARPGRLEVQHRPVVAGEHVSILETVHQLDRHRVRLGQILDGDTETLVGAQHDA